MNRLSRRDFLKLAGISLASFAFRDVPDGVVGWGSRWPELRLKDLPRKTEPCSILYRVPKILSNGNMTLCGCRDLNGDSELVLWNIKDKSILEMWRDPKVERIRKDFYSARYPNICKECSMYNDLSFFRKKKIRALFKIVH